MFTFLIVLIALIAAILCVVVLLQAGKGGGLAASFGGASSSTDSFMGGRQAANALTKMSWYGGGSFLFLALVLAVLSARPGAAPESILRQGGIPGQPRTLPDAPTSILEAAPGVEMTPSAEGAANIEMTPIELTPNLEPVEGPAGGTEGGAPPPDGNGSEGGAESGAPPPDGSGSEGDSGDSSSRPGRSDA